MELADINPLYVLIAALLLEAAVGYPNFVYRTIGHPVTWIGAIIAHFDSRWNKQTATPAMKRWLGTITVVILISLSTIAALLLRWLFGTISPMPLGFLGLVLIASTLLASRSLYDHVFEVYRALQTDGLPAGRHAVSQIVGRDTTQLDEAGVSRAAIESLAENFSDGVVAPAFWFAIAGLPGLIIYKTVNTADSMIGHLTDKHRAFGWAAAKLDDVLNWPAARLTALLLILSASLSNVFSARDAWRATLRDARGHRSPNAGWPEAAMAGALDLQLAGPRTYNGQETVDPTMGHGRREANQNDILHALALYRYAMGVGIGILVLLAILFRST